MIKTPGPSERNSEKFQFVTLVTDRRTDRLTSGLLMPPLAGNNASSTIYFLNPPEDDGNYTEDDNCSSVGLAKDILQNTEAGGQELRLQIFTKEQYFQD